MKFRQQTGKSIYEAFTEFHSRNPEVYKRFKEIVWLLVNKGKQKLSSKLIINFIRWELYVETTDDSCPYRINDAYTAHYVRLFIKEFPEMEKYFELRALRSTEGSDFAIQRELPL